MDSAEADTEGSHFVVVQGKEYRDLFYDSYKRQLFADVTLMCKNGIIKANKFVLATYSSLLEPLMTVGESSIILFDIEKNIMELLLEYMYRGCVNVPKGMASSFNNAAEKLQIKNLDKLKINLENTPEITTERNEGNMSPLLLNKHRISLDASHTDEQNGVKQPTVTCAEADEDIVTECKRKVKNPFAKCKRKNSDRSDSDSTMFNYNASTAGPSKRRYDNEASVTSLNDSDIEIIDNIPSIITVDDPKRKFRRIIPNAVTDPKKTKTKKMGKKIKKRAPMEELKELPLYKLKNFCVVCCKRVEDLKAEIKRVHAIPPRKKKYVCQICCKKFFFEKFLEIHKCHGKI